MFAAILVRSQESHMMPTQTGRQTKHCFTSNACLATFAYVEPKGLEYNIFSPLYLLIRFISMADPINATSPPLLIVPPARPNGRYRLLRKSCLSQINCHTYLFTRSVLCLVLPALFITLQGYEGSYPEVAS